jgi:hypothetical protein
MTTPAEPPTEFKKNAKGEGPSAYFTSLGQEDRRDIVSLTTDNPTAAYVRADTFELSALGANAELHGTWNPDPSSSDPSNLASWSEVGSGGRTVRAQTVRRGYLFPLGHEATFTTFYHRLVDVDPGAHNASTDAGLFPVAYLQVETSIQVTQTLKTYPAVGQPFPFASRTDFGTTDWPFQSVRMLTPASSSLDESLPQLLPRSPQAVWPTILGKDVMWSFVAIDLAGRDFHFSMPLVFVYGWDKVAGVGTSEFASGSRSLSSSLLAHYNNQPQHITHPYWADGGGQPLQFAPTPFPLKAGSTTHPALLVALGVSSSTTDNNSNPVTYAPTASEADLEAAGQPNFYPTIGSARIRMHSAEVLTGNSFADKAPATPPLGVNPVPPSSAGGVEFRFYGPYVANGTGNFGPNAPARRSHGPGGSASNAGAIYAAAANSESVAGLGSGVPLKLPGNTVGGIGTPSMGIAGLSAASGAVGGDLDYFANNNAAQLEKYFPGVSTATQAVSQLLGGLQLGNILDVDNFSMPTISSQIVPSTGMLQVTYSLSTQLTSWPTPENPGPLDLTNPIFVPDSSDAMLHLDTVVLAGQQVSGQPAMPPSFTTTGSIDPFTIYLLGNSGVLEFLSLHFESVTFTSGNGGKPSVVVNLDKTEFEGCLAFINELSQYLQSLGLGGLTIDVEPTQVTVGASITVPDVESGYFDLTGITFNACVKLPFIDGPATATFAFSSSDQPFTLTVCCFGGGGFVSLSIGFAGIVSVQAQFEFTGQLALDLYVAAGSVSLYAGIYYGYDATTGAITLTAFTRLTGQVQVLGIITVTISCYIGLSYVTVPGQQIGNVTGTATLTIGVSIFGLSKSFSFSVTKTFSASSIGSSVRRAGLNDHGPLEAAGSGAALEFENLMSATDWQTYCGCYSN